MMFEVDKFTILEMVIRDLVAKNEDLKLRNAEQAASIEDYQKDFREIKQTNCNLIDEISALQKDVDSLNEDVDSLNEDVDSLYDENEKLLRSSAESIMKLAMVTKEKEALSDTLFKLLQEHITLTLNQRN